MLRPLRIFLIVFLVLLAGFAGVAFYLLRLPTQPPAPAEPFAWLTKAMEDCDQDSAAHPERLTFLVVPLAATEGYDDTFAARALETFGAGSLFKSADALEGLKVGLLRIASEQFVFHALDTTAQAAYKWNSTSGVSKLSSQKAGLQGPFRVRLQTGPNDSDAVWTDATAQGKGACHWVFVLLRK